MGAVIVITPVLAAAWPAISASVLGAAAAMGFAQAAAKPSPQTRLQECVTLDVKGSQAITDGLAADEKLTFVKEGITLTFAREARGKCSVSAAGQGLSREQLESVGRDFTQQVIQQFAYHRLMEELSRQNFAVVAQEIGEDRTIHVQVRRFV